MFFSGFRGIQVCSLLQFSWWVLFPGIWQQCESLDFVQLALAAIRSGGPGRCDILCDWMDCSCLDPLQHVLCQLPRLCRLFSLGNLSRGSCCNCLQLWLPFEARLQGDSNEGWIVYLRYGHILLFLRHFLFHSAEWEQSCLCFAARDFYSPVICPGAHSVDSLLPYM